MAKKKTDQPTLKFPEPAAHPTISLPPDTAGPAVEEDPGEPGVVAWARTTQPVESSPPLHCVSIKVPLVDEIAGYVTRHVEVNHLTALQRESQRRLLRGLVAAEERLASGQRVQTNADAWRWVLEQLAPNDDGARA